MSRTRRREHRGRRGAAESPAARLLTVGFDGTSAPPELLELIGRGLGGVILFARNVDSPDHILRLVRQLKEASPHRPLVVSIDQEGGRVARLRGEPWAAVPPMRHFGALPEAEGVTRAAALGRLIGRELRAVGIDLDFAPVLDVDTNPESPVIGDRAFSPEAARVAALGVSFATGMQSEGVAACGKHFPGHGDTTLDSHLALPRLRHPRERLEAVELLPFRAAAKAGIAAMMTAHVVCGAVDPERPATLSPAAVDLLRQDLGFAGAVVGDDLEMQAIAASWSADEAVTAAVGAGCDQLLLCSQLDHAGAAIAAIEAAVDRGELSPGRIADAAARWNELARRYGRPAPDHGALAWLGSRQHRAAIDEALATV